MRKKITRCYPFLIFGLMFMGFFEVNAFAVEDIGGGSKSPPHDIYSSGNNTPAHDIRGRRPPAKDIHCSRPPDQDSHCNWPPAQDGHSNKPPAEDVYSGSKTPAQDIGSGSKSPAQDIGGGSKSPAEDVYYDRDATKPREDRKRQKDQKPVVLEGKVEKTDDDLEQDCTSDEEKDSCNSGRRPEKDLPGQTPNKKKPEETGPGEGPSRPTPPNLPVPPQKEGLPDPNPMPPPNKPKPSLPPLGPPGKGQEAPIPKPNGPKGTNTQQGGVQDGRNGNTQKGGTKADGNKNGGNNGNGQHGESDKEDNENSLCNLRQLAALVNDRYGKNPIAIYRVTNRGPNTFLMTLAGTELMRVFQANNLHMAFRAYVAGIMQDPNDPYMQGILRTLETLPDGSNLIIAGHSQGGMQGLNVLPYLEKSMKHRGFGVDQVVTFGSPITQLHAGKAGIRFIFVKVDGDPIPEWGPIPHHSLRVPGLPGGDWAQNHGHYKDSIELEEYDMLGIKGGKACIDTDPTTMVTFDAKVVNIPKSPSSPCEGRGPPTSSGLHRLDGITPAQLKHDPTIQKIVFESARQLQQLRDSEGRHLLKELNIQGGLAYAVLKRDTQEDFVNGVLEKMVRNKYSSLSEIPDAVRGRFNLPDWKSVERVARAIEEQHPHIEPSPHGNGREKPNRMVYFIATHGIIWY